MKKLLKTAIYASNQGYIRTRKLSVIRVIATCLQRSWGKMLGITINTNITEVYVNILNELFAWKCFKNVHESFCDWSVEINEQPDSVNIVHRKCLDHSSSVIISVDFA